MNNSQSSFSKIKNCSALFSSKKTPKKGSTPPPEHSQPPAITIKDLCLQDKNKIGNLIKRLAEEKTTNEQLNNELQQTKVRFDNQIQQLTKHIKELEDANQALTQENATVHSKLKQSLKLLEDSKKNTDNLNVELKKSQQRATTPVTSKPMCSQSSSTSPKITSNRLQTKLSQLQIDIDQKTKEKEESQGNTLKEIKGLKSEILNLTNVLKTINFTPTKNEIESKSFINKPSKTEQIPYEDYAVNKSLKIEDDVRQSRLSRSKERMREEIIKIKSEYKRDVSPGPTSNIPKSKQQYQSIESLESQMPAESYGAVHNKKQKQADAYDKREQQNKFSPSTNPSKYLYQKSESNQEEELKENANTGSFAKQELSPNDKSLSVSPIIEEIRPPPEKSTFRKNQEQPIGYDASLFSLIQEIEQEKLAQPSKVQYDSTYRKYEEIQANKVEQLYKNSMLNSSLKTDKETISGFQYGIPNPQTRSKVYYPGFMK